jgi:hypothetical protein
MKEENNDLNQKVKKLKLTISSILQRTITKEEMKKMINEGLIPIINLLIGKETVNVETQTDKDIAMKDEKIIQKIKGIEEVMQSEELVNNEYFGNDIDDFIRSLTLTEDKKNSLCRFVERKLKKQINFNNFLYYIGAIYPFQSTEIRDIQIFKNKNHVENW